MSLTKRPALLSTRPGGERNYVLDGPGHKILFEPDPRRFRAQVAGVTVLPYQRAMTVQGPALLRAVGTRHRVGQ